MFFVIGAAGMYIGDRDHLLFSKKGTGGDEPLNSFTALGEVTDEEVVQVGMSPDFKPFHQKGTGTGAVKIEPRINDRVVIRNKKSLFEIKDI